MSDRRTGSPSRRPAPPRAEGKASLPIPGVLARLEPLLLLCVATRVYFFFRVPTCAEDAYITFRFAQNWAHGFGPVYNVGEKVWGFSSPLWTSALALVSLAGLPLEQASRWILVGCDLVTLLAAWRILRRHSLAAAWGFGLFYALWPRFTMMPSTGLESSLLVALLFAATAWGSTPAGGGLTGGLALVRPEGAVMSAVLAWRLNGRQRLVWLGLAALQGFFMLYYGRLLPSSVTSKAAVYGIQALRGAQWLEWLIPGYPPQTADGSALAPVSALLLAGLLAWVLLWARAGKEERRDPAVATLLVAGFLILGVYTALGVPWFFWYAPAPMLAVLLAIFLGLARTEMLRWSLGALGLFLLLSWFTVTPHTLILLNEDAEQFAKVAQVLRVDAAGQPASVLLEPIGIVGFQTGFRVIDEIGIVTPWVAEERGRGDGWYARVMRRDPPDYLVVRKGWFSGKVTWSGKAKPLADRAQFDSLVAGYRIVPLETRGSDIVVSRLIVLGKPR